MKFTQEDLDKIVIEAFDNLSIKKYRRFDRGRWRFNFHNMRIELHYEIVDIESMNSYYFAEYFVAASYIIYYGVDNRDGSSLGYGSVDLIDVDTICKDICAAVWIKYKPKPIQLTLFD